MGNKNSRVPELDNYLPGDVEAFQKIVDEHGTQNSNKVYSAWKIGCLYMFVTKLDDSQHDIGDTGSKIIEKFMDIEENALAGDDESLRGLYCATGDIKYSKSTPSPLVKFEVCVQ